MGSHLDSKTEEPAESVTIMVDGLFEALLINVCTPGDELITWRHIFSFL